MIGYVSGTYLGNTLTWTSKQSRTKRRQGRETMAEWTVKELIETLKRFPLETKVYYEMGPNGPGTIGKAQYVKVWGDDEMGVLLDR